MGAKTTLIEEADAQQAAMEPAVDEADEEDEEGNKVNTISKKKLRQQVRFFIIYIF
jgi:hypothetical protein